MEVPKVKKLCNELNQMGVKHLIFTLDNVSLKTFGDSDSIKILGEGQEIQHLVEQVLRRANPVFFLSAYLEAMVDKQDFNLCSPVAVGRV